VCGVWVWVDGWRISERVRKKFGLKITLLKHLMGFSADVRHKSCSISFLSSNAYSRRCDPTLRRTPVFQKALLRASSWMPRPPHSHTCQDFERVLAVNSRLYLFLGDFRVEIKRMIRQQSV